MVVCESVPTKLSGYTNPSTLKTTRPRHSRFTWWTMPEPGGTIRMFLRAFAPHCKDKKCFLWGMQETRPVLTSAQRVYWRGGIVLWLNIMFLEFITMVFLHNDLRNLWKINYVTKLQKIITEANRLSEKRFSSYTSWKCVCHLIAMYVVKSVKQCSLVLYVMMDVWDN